MAHLEEVKQTKHTPGPLEVWGKQNKTEIGGFYMIGPKSSGLHGCTAYVCSQHDAKLYAAAPDLLNACLKAYDQICNHESGHKLQFQRVEDLLENAIKKATTPHE